MMTNIPYINMEKTGDNLRKLFKENGYSVKQIQDYLCLGSNQSVYSWLVGRNLPALDNLVALAWLLEVSLDELIVIEYPN